MSRRRWGAALLAAGAAEAAGRALAGVSQEPLWWHDIFTQRKEAQLRELSHAGGVDILLAGSSKTLYGLDPAVFRRRLGTTAYNSAIYRGVPRVSEIWLKEYALPLLRPGTLLMGLSPTEVNDNSPLTSRLEEYKAARARQLSTPQKALRQAGRYSYAARFAPAVLHPRTLASNLRRAVQQPQAFRWRHSPEIPGYLGPDGQGTDLEGRDFQDRPRMRELAHQQAGANYCNGGVQLGAFSEIARLAEQYGCRLVLVSMPASATFIDEVYEGGREAWQAESARLRETAYGLTPYFVDVAAELEPLDNWADLLHLNGRGRERFTNRVIDELPLEAITLGRSRRGRAA